MAFSEDDRGQAIQIGAVLLFAILVIAFSLYQAFVVPNQNQQVEINHNAEVQNQLQDLRNAIHAVVGGDPGSAVAVQLGTTYPSRLVALNPTPPSGQLRTVGTTNPAVNVTIVNATATGETGDVWNGSARPYNTGGLLYVPNYNEFNSPPSTVYENSVLYNQFTDETLTITDQSLISGDRISIVALNGSFDRGGSHSMTVGPEAISTSERTITVENGSGPIALNITTRLSPDRWRSLLSDEANVNTTAIRPAPDTTAVPDPFHRVLIPLNASEDYTLRLTKVGFGTGTTEESPEYLTDVAGDRGEIVQGQNHRIVLEVRDAYNNPQSGIRVNGSTGSGNGFLKRSWGETDDDGRVAFSYATTEATTSGTHEIQFSLDTIGGSFDQARGRDVSVNVTVTEQADGGGSNATYDLNWYRPPFQSGIVAESLPSATAPRGTPFSARATDDDQNVTFADVDYAVSDASVATVAPTTGETNATGVNTTDIVRVGDGRTRVYASSGGSGDVVNYTFDRLLYDEFEESSLLANGWYYESSGNGGDGGVTDIGSDADTGTQVAYINGDGGTTAGTRSLRMNYTINTSAYDTMTVTYVAREPAAVDDPDTDTPSENLRLQYRADDTSWVTVDNLSSAADTGLPRSYYRRVTIQHIPNVSHDAFELRFVQGDTDERDEWQIDTLDVVGVNNESVADLNGDPLAAFTYSPTEPTTNQIISFDGSWSDDPDDAVARYEWDWDNNGAYEGSGETNQHSFNSVGTYPVTLRVTDENGDIETYTRSVTVEQGVGINVRVDDLTDLAEDEPRLIGSYNLSNTSSSFTRVDISFANQNDASADQTFQLSSQRGGVEYNNNYGSTDTYEVTFEVIYTINGSETVVASETVTDTADGENPAGNSELANSTSAQFNSWRIKDQSKSQDGAVYQFKYDLDPGSFSSATLGVIRPADSSATEVQSEPTRSIGNTKISPPDGYGEEYRLVIAVRDAEGAVVRLVDITDVADKSGTFPRP